MWKARDLDTRAMGCKGSKEAMEEENREDGAPGSAGLANEATKGPETKHVRQLRLDNGAAAADENMNKVRKEKKAEKANEIAQTDSKPSLVMNAWDAPRAGKAGQLEKIENVPKGPTQEELLRDMEFDKEGIDLCSSAIDGGARPPTPLHKSLLKVSFNNDNMRIFIAPYTLYTTSPMALHNLVDKLKPKNLSRIWSLKRCVSNFIDGQSFDCQSPQQMRATPQNSWSESLIRITHPDWQLGCWFPGRIGDIRSVAFDRHGEVQSGQRTCPGPGECEVIGAIVAPLRTIHIGSP